MVRSTSEPAPQSHAVHSANDRLKAAWGPSLAKATAVAALAHLVLFVGLPSWERSAPAQDLLTDFLQLEWVSILDAGAPPAEEPARTVALGILPDSIPDGSRFATGISGEEVEIATITEAFRERLTGRLAPAPTVVEVAEAELLSSEGSDAGDERTSIGVDRSLTTSDFPDLPGTNPLDLDRLSAVRPELVMAVPSAWVLIRNPAEIEQFIMRRYVTGELSRSANGSVSVAIWIDERGSVEWAEISESSGRQDIDEVALALFSEVAAFRPARDEGVPVARSVIFSVRFPWMNN